MGEGIEYPLAIRLKVNLTIIRRMGGNANHEIIFLQIFWYCSVYGCSQFLIIVSRRDTRQQVCNQ